MGQIPNKTYTAPDGSVFRVEDDGSITKIKNGRIKSTEPPSKYQITPDGKIYRLEDDGSVTYLGNAEERQQTPPPPSFEVESLPEKPKSKKWIGRLIACAMIAMAIIAIVIGVIYSESNRSYDYINDEIYCDTELVEESVYTIYVDTIEEAPVEVAAKEVPATAAYDSIGF